jgi:dTMP kinase
MREGRFITIDGIDGAGKTCNLAWMKSWLEQAGKRVICTREPGGTMLGEEIRKLLLRDRIQKMQSMSELLLLYAARAEHIATLILPSLERGDWVLCDRFSDATYAYQGGGRCLNLDTIANAEFVFTNNLQPDLTILLDIPVEISKTRSSNRNSAQNHFDQESIMFLERVRSAYLQRAAMYPQRICVINAARELTEVQTEIVEHIKRMA